MTPAIASGCSDCSSRARMPPTNIDASPCTWRIRASSLEPAWPDGAVDAVAAAGPSGPATRAKSFSPRLVRRSSSAVVTGFVGTSRVCPRSVHRMLRWESWSGLTTARPAQVLSPASTAEVVDAVVAARDHGLTVKMVGSGHSFTDIARDRRPAAAPGPARRGASASTVTR